MNESIISQVFAVLDKYNKSYTKDGVLKNLNQWETNKGPLVDLLRRHPDWDEDALAIVFEVTQSREIDRYIVNAYSSHLLQLCNDLNLPSEDATNLNYSLNTAIGPYAKLLPDEQVVSSIKQYSGVSCAIGQKTSRAINRICQKYGLDKHPEYNTRFAQLADSLNPMQVIRTALLSVHPCDYLEMSNEDNSWSSCHCIREGEYHAGTLSYMSDSVSMIFCTVDKESTGDFHRSAKITRQVFCFGGGILLQSRLYPQTDDEETRDIYRDIVQRTISHCLDIPNLWKLHRKLEDVDRYCRTHSDALHYTDYSYDSYKPNISLLESVQRDDTQKIVIGHTAFCLGCANKLYDTNSLYCDRCNGDVDYIACEGCGGSVERDSDDDYYVSGAHYCRDCVSWCEHCEEYTRDEMTHVTDCDGRQIHVCEYCRDDHYSYCVDCGSYYDSDAGEALDDGCHCRRCLGLHYSSCDCCSDYVRYENGVEIDGNLYCSDCAEAIQLETKEIREECFVTA